MAKTQLTKYGVNVVIGFLILILVSIICAVWFAKEIMHFVIWFPPFRGWAAGLSSFYYLMANIFESDKVFIFPDWSLPTYGKFGYWFYMFGELSGVASALKLFKWLIRRIFHS